MQIHDELVFEAREDVLPHAARIVKRVMEVRHAAVIMLGVLNVCGSAPLTLHLVNLRCPKPGW